MRLLLPFPPSVNNLYMNVRGKGRCPTARYRNWRERATAAMWGQKLEVFDGPVKIEITFEDAGRADLDNLAKSLVDHLVHHQLIRDDSREWVRDLRLRWGDVKGAVVEVSAV